MAEEGKELVDGSKNVRSQLREGERGGAS